jgi:EmrB/QacA subfamily drug resistance transporter
MSAPSSSRRSAALVLIAAGQFVVIMDTSIIGVALPGIQADLGFSQEALSWVFNAYVVAFGGLLLLGGRLADLFGARRVFSTGWVVLATGSVVAGIAGSEGVELAGRALQGVGAALIAPSGLALLMTIFGARPRELTRALALYGAAAPAGGTAGVFLGGVLTQYVSWPWVFYVNIPIALAVVLAAPAVLPGGGRAVRGSVDVIGAITVTAAIGAAVYGIVRAPEVGWASVQTWAVLAGALLLLGVFLVVQAVRREPLVRLSIFRTPNLAAANLAQLLLGGAWIPMWFFLNLYLQQVLGYSAFPAGAALLPMTVLIMVGMIAIVPRAIGRFGPQRMTVAGLLVLGAGMGWLSLVSPSGSFVVDVLPASLVAALGMALAFIPSLGMAISAARPEEGGLAAGIVNTSYQVGSALGLAVMTAVAASFGATRLGDGVALTSGFSAAFLGAGVLALVGGLAAAATLRAPRAAGDQAGQEIDQPAPAPSGH